MTSYLVLEAPGGPDTDHRTTRFIADRFVWLALVAPWLWLAVNRLWLAATAAFAVLLLAGQISTLAGFEPAGFIVGIAISLITALEGRNFLICQLVKKGWQMKSIVTAPDLSTAEDLYFSERSTDIRDVAIPMPEWTPHPEKTSGNSFINDPSGSFLFDLNGRR